MNNYKYATFHLREEEFPQYNKKSNGTLLIQKPAFASLKEALLNKINSPTEPVITLYAGSSHCHPEDQFNKKIGRSMAAERLDPIDFNIHQVSFFEANNCLNLTLEGVNSRLRVKYFLFLNYFKDKERVNLLGAGMRSWENG